MGSSQKFNIAVIGLGYVGLPLAIEFSKHYSVVGYDISAKRIAALNNLTDNTLEVSSNQLNEAINSGNLELSTDLNSIQESNFFIVTVPTPIDNFKVPDLRPIKKAAEEIGTFLKSGDIVVFESTVFPGVTEDICAPILEIASGLTFNKDFYCGYSPERINPGDKEHTLTSIIKITSGSTPKIATIIDSVYSSIIDAGTHLASSIKIAESAKVIENIQRDVNIALINELATIFKKMDIPTSEVLAASGTKWNFLNFHPGLVGGHCIGVDPYYLTYKANSLGLNPELILASRRINDEMPNFVANAVIKLMIERGLSVLNANVLVYGVTFKANCPDTRNTKVVNLINELSNFGCNISVIDPHADKVDMLEEHGIKIFDESEINVSGFDCVVYAVNHRSFNNIKFNYDQQLVFDVTSSLPNCPNSI
tara:strand:+ start:4451 stop:5719 length:1269 start_codon:yes stop_codon:yes gene_type:complete